MKQIKIPYSKAKDLLREADVLLFRGRGFISSLIKIAGEGLYSHVAVASKHKDLWECVEYREWHGGRIISLENYLQLCKKENVDIDVYRTCPKLSYLEFDSLLEEVKYKQIDFDPQSVTNSMRELTGMPYSYKRILLILRIKLFRWRILWDIEKITNDIPSKELVMPVCSTTVSHSFAKHGFPLLKRKSDEYFEPSDFSLSPRLNYLFTLD